MADLTVLGQDPRYGGGAAAQMEAFLMAARALGHDPRLVYVPHPVFDGRRVTLDRFEALRVRRGAAEITPPLWVVATTAHHGIAAAESGVSYDAWIGTSLDDEWRGRTLRMPASRRLVHAFNVRPLRSYERRVLCTARRVFATSPWSRRTVAAAAGIDESTVGILPLPVDTCALTPEPDDVWLRRVEQAPVLVFVGRADDPRKNVQLLLEAAKLLPHVKVRLVGTPPRIALPPNVEVVGRVTSIAEHLRTASLCVVPAFQEGFGIAAAEALAAGVPVVATRSGGPEDLVERSRGGVLLDGWSPGELARRCAELLANPSELAERRWSGRSYVEREHSPQALASALGEALHDTS